MPDPRTLSNRGERLVDGDEPGQRRNHEARYLFARRFIAPESWVLDCACGSGYGTAILAAHVGSAGFVHGLDVSRTATAHCRKAHRSPNVEFKTGSAEKLPFPDASFDAYCCFETLEHVPNPAKALQDHHFHYPLHAEHSYLILECRSPLTSYILLPPDFLQSRL